MSAAVTALIGVCLWYGARHRRRIFVLAWLVVVVFVIVVDFVQLILTLANASGTANTNGVIVGTVVPIINTGDTLKSRNSGNLMLLCELLPRPLPAIHIYFWLVILSYYKDLAETEILPGSTTVGSAGPASLSGTASSGPAAMAPSPRPPTSLGEKPTLHHPTPMMTPATAAQEP